ncbi:hypothetical protein C8R43DRAFT_842165, partial [Mycena crocata]
PLPPPHRLSTPPKQAEQDISEVAFACRCGDCGPDWTVFERGLVVVQCEDCKAWSHMSCQRYGRASKLRKKEAFICDYCMAPSKTLLEKQDPRPRAVGRGALAKWGKYHYPVRLLQKEKETWRVTFWRGCEFPIGITPPENVQRIVNTDLVDSLFGNTERRRLIRLGKYTHAHEIPLQEDILEDFLKHAYPSEIDDLLRPHVAELDSLLSTGRMFSREQVEAYPAVRYVVMQRKETVPFGGPFSLIEQAQIMNWFHHNIPAVQNQQTGLWVGHAAHSHALTLVVAKMYKEKLYNGTQAVFETLSPLDVLELAFSKLQAPVVISVDVDHECLALLEEWMFESSNEAGIAGEEQWGLNTGRHQDGWNPYSGL